MKLIFCPECHDIRRLTQRKRMCTCRRSWGQYDLDGLHAAIGGLAVPLGIANPSFAKALQDRPESGLGSAFNAFVIPRVCDTVHSM